MKIDPKIEAETAQRADARLNQKFKVTYNNAPTGQNTEKCLIIEAPSEIEAVITAFDHLTQRGNVVARGYGIKLSSEDQKLLNDRGVRFDLGGKAGQLVITGVDAYTVESKGKVVG